MRGIAEEVVDPKYAHVERERRFLIDPRRRPSLDDAPCTSIEDRYIVGSRLRLRRMTNVASGRIVMKLTKKYDVPDVLARPMATAYLDRAEYELLLTLPARCIDKRRSRIAVAGQTFAVDVFDGDLAGLETAEIEQGDAAALADVAVPDWALLEVSHDPRFQGGHLAMLTRTTLLALLTDVRDLAFRDGRG